MAKVDIPRPKAGDGIVSMDPKMFEDYKAKPGEKALIVMHTVPYEGSVGLINMLTTTRIVRKGYDTTLPSLRAGCSDGFFLPRLSQRG